MDPNISTQPTVPVQSPTPVPISSMEPTPTVLPPTKKSNGILILGIVLLIISLLTLVVYFVYQNYQLRISLSSPTPIAQATPTATPDITADWKTYTDKQIGFELKYPTNTFKVTTNPTKIVNTILPPETGGQADEMNGLLYFEISVTPLRETTTLNDWVTKNWGNQETDTQTNTRVNGIDVIIFDGGNKEPKTNKYMFAMKDNNIINISAHYLNFQASQYYNQIKNLWVQDADQILSTFKFTK